uniref:C2H2-type domain-containing protein n=1 Tax=Anopheles epiroticus TaxID=199890 RepID=A0A182PNH9_9DIPT
ANGLATTDSERQRAPPSGRRVKRHFISHEAPGHVVLVSTMNHNNRFTPLWPLATNGGGHPPSRGTNSSGSANINSGSSKVNAGNISSVRLVTNPRSNMKILNISGHQASGTSTNENTLLCGTTLGGSFLTVATNQQRQGQSLLLPPPQRPNPTTPTATNSQHHLTAMLNEPILVQTSDGREYLVDERAIQQIDQIPPENLIYMTESEELSVVGTDDVSQLSIVDENQLELDGYVDAEVPPVVEALEQQPAEMTQYAEECEVTEEVITDDWVQAQGEDCVQVTVDQLGVSSTVVEEDDISVPLDQDEYTLSRPYPCDFCSRRFRKKSSLQNHLMAHSNDRPHMCNLCGAQYSHRCDLLNHLKQHAYTVAEQDELSMRSDQEAECMLDHVLHLYPQTDFLSFYPLFSDDLPDLTNASSVGHTIKHRVRHSSEDEDMYIQNSMVSYNSQPPMQLISTSNYGASSSLTGSYGHEEAMELEGGVDQQYTVGEVDSTITTTTNTTPTTFKASPGKRTPRKRLSAQTNSTTARTKPVLSNKTTAARSNVSSNRQIKKEPTENATSDAISVSRSSSGSFPVTDWRKPFVCQQCGVGFGREKALLSHSRTHADSNTRYDCRYCNLYFWEQAALEDHVYRVHSQSQQQQQQTRKLETWVTDHGSPLALVGEGATTGQYNCDSCSAVFYQLGHLLNHTQQAHGPVDSYQTNSNGKVMIKQELMKTPNHEQKLNSHAEVETTDHEVEEEEEYDDIDYTIEHYEHRPDDQELNSQSSSLTCRDCGESFDAAVDLLEHSEVHSGNRCEPLECQLCGEKFLDETTIKQHVQDRHGDELTATSCAICGKRCKSQTTLMKHAWDHSRERAHSCSKCGKTFHHMTRLKRHMDSHRNKAVNSPFTTTSDLVQHLIVHSDTNTAMKRKPPTFPRKYKRRRKLKPHELERLQSGRRKQKSKRQDDVEEEEEQEEEEEEEKEEDDGDDGEHTRTKGTVEQHHLDGALKSSTRELFLQYEQNTTRSLKPPSRPATQGMLDDNGINLLSNVVLLHGQREESHTKLQNNNHLPESSQLMDQVPAKAKPQTATAGSSRMIYTQKSKPPVTPRRMASRKRPPKEQPVALPSNTGNLQDTEETDPGMANAMEAFFRDRKRNSSLLPEIPPHKISSVSFPLLDDGNTDDPMDEPDQPRRTTTTSFSASEDDLNHQLLMEISNMNKFTERFNSDTVNDLEEILRSPIKSGPPVVAKRAATATKKQPSVSGKKPASAQRNRTVSSKAKVKPKSKVTTSSSSAANTSSTSRQQKSVEKKLPPEPPAVLRSQRLTRRQLEREVNFLKEAYETDPAHNSAMVSKASTMITSSVSTSSGKVVKTELIEQHCTSHDGVLDTMERLGSSERLAAMLLNDGLPEETQNSSGEESSRRSSVSNRQALDSFTAEAYAEGLHMIESGSVVKQEEDEEHENDGHPDDGSQMYHLEDSNTTSTMIPPADGGPLHRCSICAACFVDRAQLILHVPVHI